QVAAHQDDLVAEPGRATRRADALLQPRRRFRGGVGEDVLLGEAGGAQRGDRPRGDVVVVEREDDVIDRIQDRGVADVFLGQSFRGHVVVLLVASASLTPARRQDRAYCLFRRCSQASNSPTKPRRKAMTQTTKIAPMITVTHSPTRSESRFCSPMIVKAPITGPANVPMPPSSVIRTTSPETDQCASESEAKPSTIDFSAPARPAIEVERTNASSLYLSTS